MPYVTTRGRKRAETTLVYTYDEDVFDAADAGAINLATMIGLQVALNYGLFCRHLVLRGRIDTADQRFINFALENTAREIYVNKFLKPNPFIIGAAAGLPGEKRSRYATAQVEFPDAWKPAPGTTWAHWTTERDQHAILSSGGKDSLLSYALLNEAGFTTHPLFVNESGRHWFTALNAFRHFSAHVPNTARVWVNCDRVFLWMLRQMPFVRPDFSRLRSDAYPIRLWTVAVFLFGVLPLLRKRGIGRLLIGDEYDSTVRQRFRGITHYSGLYDQSRYFDRMMSRYFLSKGWSVSQFSVLRQMSELLIEKVLVQRYADLQAQQVSCHATHTRNGRVYPCGKCEKCRRIVGMLVALGARPQACGYNASQIRECLQAVASQSFHQEREGAAQMLWMLNEQGHIGLDPELTGRLRPYPEVLKLRFDADLSPLTGIPADLRRPVLRTVLEHCDGAVTRSGRSWQPYDPLVDPALGKPYDFEPAGTATGPWASDAPYGGRRDYLWAHLTWPEAKRRLDQVDIALLPVGALEQHGPHLTLDVDAFDAEHLARRVAAACSDPRPLVLPLIAYGVSYHHDDFKGTVSITNDTLGRLIYDIGMSVAKNGIRKLVIVNGHGDNAPTLSYAAQMINRDAHIFVCVDTGETSDVDIEKLASTPNDVHAGEIETSTSLAARPDLVQTDKLKRFVPRFSSRYLNFSSKHGLPWYARTQRISASGVMGDPTKASAEKGTQIWEVMISHLVALVEDLKALSLDEIYQRRY